MFAPFHFADISIYLVYAAALIIGLGFGAVLEMSGFGNSKKLTDQFYLKDMTVFKVFFTTIIVAMSLLFFFTGVEIVDFAGVYVNSTYLLPGIIGGLIMGVGFIIGGFCPGTSLVAAATLKIDGIMFVTGGLFGAALFGETLPFFEKFSNSTYMGRFTLDQLFGTSKGIMVLIVIISAIILFIGAEISEKHFGEGKKLKDIPIIPTNNFLKNMSIALVVFSVIIIAIGQPSVEDRWNVIKGKEQIKLDKNQVQVHPLELLEFMNETAFYSTILDVRSESDFNYFHLEDAINTKFSDLENIDFIHKLLDAPSNNINFIVSNDEKAATIAYKMLKAQGVLNLYILDGGINNWIDHFHISNSIATKSNKPHKDDSLKYIFKKSVGSQIPLANPKRAFNPHDHGDHEAKYAKKVKVQKKKVLAGGCG